MTASTTTTPFWQAANYIAERNRRMYDMAVWFADAVDAGHLNPEGDLFKEFSDVWDDTRFVNDELERIEEWCKSDAVDNGYRICVGPRTTGEFLSGANMELIGRGDGQPAYFDAETGEVIQADTAGLYVHEDRIGRLALDIQDGLDTGRAIDAPEFWEPIDPPFHPVTHYGSAPEEGADKCHVVGGTIDVDVVEADEERGADRYYRAKCSCRWWYSEPLASREIAVSVGNKHVRVDA